MSIYNDYIRKYIYGMPEIVKVWEFKHQGSKIWHLPEITKDEIGVLSCQ